VLLRGEPEPLSVWLEGRDAKRVVLFLAVIGAGAGLYGAAMGCARAAQQALYTAVKFPLIILLTTLGNAALNGTLAPLLGLNFRFRQSLLAILMSFATAAAILGSFSPVMFFVAWNLPPMSSGGESHRAAYDTFKLVQVTVIAFAGVVANVRLLRLLRRQSGSAAVARKVVFAWLAGNLLLGSQLAWILRPFVGAPFLDVQFLRPNAFESNLFENVLRAIRDLLAS
jgi:hypothetical protein